MVSPRLAGRLIIVCGLPGSGKTTRARRLAAERGGVRFNADEWMTALGAELWDAAMRARVESLQWRMATDLLRFGATAIIEWGTWSSDERDSLRTQARELGASVELHYLDVPLTELWDRVQRRGMEEPRVQRSDLDGWWSVFQRPDAAEMSRYDEPDTRPTDAPARE